MGRKFKQLLQNESGESGLNHWHIISPSNSGDGWKVIPSNGSEQSAFITSHQWCIKSQEVNLLDSFTKEFLDCSPEIYVLGRFHGVGPDFKDKFFLKIEIRDSEHKSLASFNSGECIAADEWKEISHTFRFYGPGAR